jgi:LytS/YehU family sensor histidine kinase
MNEIVRLVEDLAQVSVTIILAYVAYKIAVFVEALTSRIKSEDDVNKKEKNL